MKLFGNLPEEDLLHLAITSKETLQELESVNFIVVGASGFFGNWISTFLAYLSFNGIFKGTITLILRNPGKIQDLRKISNSHKLHILDSNSLEAVNFSHLNSNRTVILFAATSTSMSGKEISIETESSLNLAKKITFQLAENKPTFVHLSSGGLYHPKARLEVSIPADYDLQLKSKDSYIQEKASLERWSIEQHEKGVIVSRNPRLFTFYGPGLQLDRHFVISEFMARGIAGLPILITGNPNNLRSYLYPSDSLLQIFRQCLVQEPEFTQIGSSVPRTIFDVAKYVAEEFKVPLRIVSNNVKVFDNYIPADVPLTPERDIRDGIKKWRIWLEQDRR
jgi:nucleoside-diphosphate-sugar epimerase